MGGTGFIGGYLAKKLSARQGCEIIIIHNNDLPLGKKFDNICYYQLNLAEPNKEFKELVNFAEIIVILTRPDERIIDNLISAIKPASQLKKIIYFSSLLLYNNFPGRQNEKSSLKPITDYERVKCAEELKLLEFVQKNSFKLCITRLANVYGDIKNKGVINFILLSMLNGGEVVINGKGDSIRDYIFIEDAIAWLDFIIFWNQKNKKEIINLCAGKGYNVKELVWAVEQIFKKKIKTIAGARVKEKKIIIGDNKKIIALSGRKLKYDLIKGLKKTHNNYDARI